MNINTKLSFIAALFICNSSYAQNTQGFFLDNHQNKKAEIPESYLKYIEPTEATTVEITIDYSKVLSKVSKYLYGNNANPYMTDIIGQPELLSHIKTLAPQIIRYPGGNISNVFFWNAAPGQKPHDVPDTLLYPDKKPRRER